MRGGAFEEIVELTRQLKQLSSKNRKLKKLARALYSYVEHDSCAGDDNIGIDDSECDCGLREAIEMYRRLMR